MCWCRPTTRRSSCGCWRMWPTSRRCARASPRGEDIHARTASEVFGIPMAGMDPMTRRRAKAINFGIIYGISGFGLARQLGITPGEARAYIDAYFVRYPGIRDYMERTKEEARINGYVTHAVRPALLGAGHRRQEPGAPRLCRTPGDQRAAAGRRRPTSSSARWCGCRTRCGEAGLRVAAAAAGARRTAVRGAGGRGADADRRWRGAVMESARRRCRCRWWWRPAPAGPGPRRTEQVGARHAPGAAQEKGMSKLGENGFPTSLPSQRWICGSTPPCGPWPRARMQSR